MTGKLRQRVTVQAKTDASDGQGGYTQTWSAGTTVWADVTHLSGKRLETLGQVYSGAEYEVAMRYHTASAYKQGDYRFVYNSETLNILHAYQKDERNTFIYFICARKSG